MWIESIEASVGFGMWIREPSIGNLRDGRLVVVVVLHGLGLIHWLGVCGCLWVFGACTLTR